MALQLLRKSGLAIRGPLSLPVFQTLRQLSSTTGASPNVREHNHSEPTVSPYTPGSFEDVFSKSSFVRAGKIRGRTVRAKIVAMNKTHMRLDLGTKFYSYVPIPGQASSFKIGDEVIVTVYATDFTQHVTGDARPISLFMGDVKFNQQVSASRRN